MPDPDLGIREGITASNIDEVDALIAGVAGLGLSVIFGVSVIDQATAVPEREGHLPKPGVLMPGIDSPSAVPQVLPVALMRIGSLAVLGIPGELTTMAGRRLRTTVLDVMSGSGIKHVALGTYANEYAQYITTREEYSSQQYEGASTRFGPHTLEAYQQVAAKLATAIVQATVTEPGPAPTPWTSPPQRRYRFRNLSGATVKLKFYGVGDTLEWFTLPNGAKTIAAGSEVAYPEREFTGPPPLPTVEKVKVWVSDGIQLSMAAGQLLTIEPGGSIAVADYTPPPR